MDDQSLRDAYERALHARATGEVPPVSLERLEALVEGSGSEEERLRTLDAALSSTEGRRELDVLWAASRAASPPRNSTRVATSPSFAAPRWRQYALAATLMCAVGLSGVWWRSTTVPSDPADGRGETLRGDDAGVQLVAPRKGTIVQATGTQFVWRRVSLADRYLLVLVDRTGREVFSMNTADTALTLPDSSRLTPGTEYLWWVQASMADGSTLSASSEAITVGPASRP